MGNRRGSTPLSRTSLVDLLRKCLVPTPKEIIAAVKASFLPVSDQVQLSMNMKKEDIDFLINKCPMGLFVFNRQLDIVFNNKQASVFLRRYELPGEIYDIGKRIFDAISAGKLQDFFPGEIFLTKRFDGSPSNWIFKVYIFEKSDPLVYLLITEEKMSNKINMNDIRRQFKLTRRETDILRRVVDGLKNAEIAYDLEISEQTIKDHLSNIYMKVGAENRMALMRTLLQISEMPAEGKPL